MKRLLFLFLLFPFISEGQYLAFSGMAGYSFTKSVSEQGMLGGLSTQLSLTYPFTRRLLFGAYYENNIWVPARNVFVSPNVRNNATYGVTLDITGESFFLGGFVGLTKFKTVNDDSLGSFEYHRTVSFGIRTGLKQRIATGLYVTECASVGWTGVKGIHTYTANRRNNPNPYTSHTDVSRNLTVLSLKVGLIYEFGHKPVYRKKERIPMESESEVGHVQQYAPPKKAKKKKEKAHDPNRYMFTTS